MGKVSYGDVSIIEQNYDAGMRYLSYLKTKVNEDGFINHGLGDWGNPDKELARKIIETAFLYADTMALAEFANILGRDKDKKGLLEYASSVRDNYNSKLLMKNSEGKYYYRSYEHGNENIVTQACEALPLYYEMVPDGAKNDVVEAFKATLLEKNCFASGEIGLPYIIQVAREYGMNEEIADFITRREHPSYYAFILDGMTTLGEYWEKNPRSHCHDMMGHIIEWYYNGIAGIQPKKPGFSEISVKPFLPMSMHCFTCKYRSASGEIIVDVTEGDNSIILSISVPHDMKCEVNTCQLLKRGKEVVVKLEHV